jgi:integrase
LEKGKVVGTLGVLPRTMEFRGRPIVVATATLYMANPDHRHGPAAVQLLGQALKGPQDLFWTDGASGAVSAFWRALGGYSDPLYALNWIRVLRPFAMEADGITAVGEAVTVKKATDAFETDAKNNIEASTLKQYKILLTRLNKYCEQHGYVFLKQLGVVQLRDFRNSWTTYSPRTAGKHIERLKRFFSWCVENGWLQASPAKPLKPPKVGETDVVPFSEEEIENILKACDAYPGPNRERLVVLTKLMLTTGLAIGDASMLSKDRVIKNGSGWYVELRRAKTGTAVSCPIPNDLGKVFHALEGKTPFWTGKCDLKDLTKNWRKIYTRPFQGRWHRRTSAPVSTYYGQAALGCWAARLPRRYAVGEL